MHDLLVDNDFTQVAAFSYTRAYQGNVAAPGPVIDAVTARSRFIAFRKPSLAAFNPFLSEIEALPSDNS